MSDYTQVNDYSAKDALTTGDPNKKILGSDIDAELSGISTAIASKANSASPTLTSPTLTGTVTVSGATIAGNATISGNNTHSGTVTMSGKAINTAEGANVASAATADIWTPADGNTVHITGTTTITSLGTAPQAGATRRVIFDGALTLTHGANLNLPGAANITTAAGDSCIVYADTTTQLDVFDYTRASGKALIPAGIYPLVTKTASASASLTFTSSDFSWTAYDRIRFDINKIVPATAGAGLVYQISSDGGSTWKNSSYVTQVVATRQDGTGRNVAIAVDTQVILNEYTTVGMSTNASGGITISVTVTKPSATGWKEFIHSPGAYYENNGADAVVLINASSATYTGATTAVTGIKFFANSGNLTSGSITAFGIKDS